jgi:LuxR family maltose regulon positive regulatory protein
VLDDFEVVHSQEVLDAVAFVLDHQPPNLHLVLCSRGEPHLPLPLLRARGQLAEVTGDDLRFTLDEVARFLEEAMALRVSPQGRRALHTRTEGWITGLQLAALSLRRTADREHFIATTGDHRYVAILVDGAAARAAGGAGLPPRHLGVARAHRRTVRRGDRR